MFITGILSLIVCLLLETTTSSTPAPVTCGGKYTGDSGVITTPGYPEKYAYETTCEWLIEAPMDHVIKLNFTDFDVEDFAGSCDFDKVVIYNGETTSSPVLGKVLCGQNTPEVVTSTERYLLIRFQTDYLSQGGRGFSARYEAMPADNGKHCYENLCGGTIENTPTCNIQSPGYPAGYQENLDCSWLVKAPSAEDRITFEFLDITFEDANARCSHSNVTIYDGGDSNARVIYEPVCDISSNRLTAKKLFSTGGTILIRMKTSRASNEYPGFQGVFNILSESTSTTTTTTTTTTSTVKPTVSTIKSSVGRTTTLTTTTTPPTRSTRTSSIKFPSHGEEGEAGSISDVTEDTNKILNIAQNPAALSGLVIGAIVFIAIIVLGILLVVAYVHWKRQNKRFIRLQRDSDVNTLLSSVDSIDYKKSNGRIVRTPESEPFNQL